MFKVFGGPMFAGKTTALLTEAASLPPGSFVFIKPSLDDRYLKEAVVSHDGQQIAAEVISAVKPVFPVIDTQNTKTVFIDELNFFDYDTLWPQMQTLLKQGVNIIGAGLLYDFRHEPFGSTLPLSKQADQFTELFARCDNCGKKADHSYRKVSDSAQLLVGAQESYGACCQECLVAVQR
jgi:thymidine kinase